MTDYEKCAYVDCQNASRESSIYCSQRCQQAAWREKNRQKLAKRARWRYHEEKKRKASEGWDARREAIIEAFGVTRVWRRKQAQREAQA